MRTRVALFSLTLAACGGGGGDAGDDDPSPDAAAGCAPAAEHVEADDEGNGDAAEPTDLVVTPQAAATVGGCIDPARQAGAFVDTDLFQFRVEGTGPLFLTISLTSDAHPGGTDAAILDANQGLVVGAGAGRDGGLAAPVLVSPGDYRLLVGNGDLGDVAAPFAYHVEIEALICGMGFGPGHTESADGAGRDNDMIAAMLTPGPFTYETPTADAPEATGLTVPAGDNLSIDGVSLDLPRDGDAYHDRDTYALSLGADVRRVIFRADWAAGDDGELDLMLFGAGTVTPPLGYAIGGGPPDHVGALATGDVWLWVARKGFGVTEPAAPLAYRATLCAFD